MKKAKLIFVYASWLLITLVASQAVIAEELITADFIQYASAQSVSEVAAAKLALKTSNSPAVRAYAQDMLDEHSVVLVSLQTLAQQEGVAINMDSQQHAFVFIRKGETFDIAYASKRTAVLKRLVRVMRKAIFSESPDVRHYAEKTLPVLMQHWYQSQSLVHSLQNPAIPVDSIVATR